VGGEHGGLLLSSRQEQVADRAEERIGAKRSAKWSQVSPLSVDSRILSSEPNCCRMPPPVSVELAAPGSPRSTSVTFVPRSASAMADASPMHPPPITRTPVVRIPVVIVPSLESERTTASR
jgi:hypothetical protein